jgi:predicted alpha/beta superfamily hydrolase
MREKFFSLLLILLVPSWLIAQIAGHNISSKHTGDKYVIKIKNHNPQISQHVIYVADGSLKLGNYILGTDESWKATVPANCVIVTIAHVGDWSMKRQRDFIPSDAGGYKDGKFAQSNKFYLFLKDELQPFINKKITKQIDRSFIGHSFSGLFSLYASLQTEKLFERYFAISPSIWANYYELDKIEKAYAEKQKILNGTIMLFAGGLEILNKVLSSTTAYYKTVKGRNYQGLSISFVEINNANHFSIIKPAVDKILKSIN